MSAKGVFIVFEGIDGCGKKTQLDLAYGWLLRAGRPVDYGSEPNELISPLSRYIRTVLKGRITRKPSGFDLQRMFTLDRAQDLICFIRPVLAQGTVVLWERFFHSTLAYGMLEGNVEVYLRLQHDVLGSFMLLPDLTFIIDISGAEALRRLSVASREAEYFEKEKTLERVRQNYLALAQRDDLGEMVVVNGKRAPEEIFKEVKDIIQQRFEI